MKPQIAKVVSTKMTKTVVVELKRQKIHPLYKKIMIRTTRFKVHCEDTNIKVGDWVKVATTRPISKQKHYKVVGKVDKAEKNLI